MPTSDVPSPTALDAEAAAWRNLPPDEYDRAVCSVIERLPAADPTLLPLASATLRRHTPTLTDSVARCAERLIAFAATQTASEPERARSRWLLLLALFRLAAVAASAPATIDTSAALPEDVVLPTGADPSAIADDDSRHRALAAVHEHREAVARWNAKQRALRHLEYLAGLLSTPRPGITDDPEVEAELVTVIALATGASPADR